MTKSVALLCILLPANAQTDIFNSTTGNSCDQKRAAEKLLYNKSLAALSARRADIEAEYTKDMATCRNRALERAAADRNAGRRADTTCQDQASLKESKALNDLDAETASENARHRKAELSIDGDCNYKVEQYDRTARLPGTPIVISKESLAGGIVKNLSNTKDPIEMTRQVIDGGVLLFVPEIKKHVEAELISTDEEVRALRAKRQKTIEEQQRINFLDLKTVALKDAMRHLRTMYTDKYNGLREVERYSLPRPDQLNWPQYSY